jgi:hypothetical protein
MAGRNFFGQELRRLAHRYMRQERTGIAFQTTELVNEVYLKLRSWMRASAGWWSCVASAA